MRVLLQYSYNTIYINTLKTYIAAACGYTKISRGADDTIGLSISDAM